MWPYPAFNHPGRVGTSPQYGHYMDGQVALCAGVCQAEAAPNHAPNSALHSGHSFLCQGMVVLNQMAQTLIQHMSIDLRGGNIRMAEHLLHRAQVRAMGQ